MQKNTFSKIKKWLRENNAIDAVLFGSYVRSKDNPKDIDICLIIPDAKEKESIDLLSSFKQIFQKENIHVTILTEKEFIISGNPLVKTLLNEGVSITKNESLSKIYGFENQTLFTYSLNGFKPSDRVRFHYALRGRRGTKGVLSEAKAKMLGGGIIAVSTNKEDLIKSVFDMWGVKYKTNRILSG